MAIAAKLLVKALRLAADADALEGPGKGEERGAGEKLKGERR